MNYTNLANELFEACTNRPRLNAYRKAGKFMFGEAFALNFLYGNNNIAYPRELSEAMNVSSARIARLLNRLESDNKINRTPDPDDCRKILVTITDSGIQEVLEQKEKGMLFFSSILEQLGEEDAKEYVRINKKIASIIGNNLAV